MRVRIEVTGATREYMDIFLEIEKVNLSTGIDIELLQLRMKNPNGYVQGRFPGEVVKVESRIKDLEYQKTYIQSTICQFTIESVCDFLQSFPYIAKDKALYIFFTIEGKENSENVCVEIVKGMYSEQFTLESAVAGLKKIEQLAIEHMS